MKRFWFNLIVSDVVLLRPEHTLGALCVPCYVPTLPYRRSLSRGEQWSCATAAQRGRPYNPGGLSAFSGPKDGRERMFCGLWDFKN